MGCEEYLESTRPETPLPGEVHKAGNRSDEDPETPQPRPTVEHNREYIFCDAAQDYYFMVLEYCDGGNLLTYQSKLKTKTFPIQEALEIIV